jgi:amidase
MKTISSDKIIYAFNPKHAPIARVKTGEILTIETQDAFGGQIKSEKDSVEKLDWSKVDGATGPIFIEGAMPGDTLVVEIVNIKVPEKGVMVTVQKCGILAEENVKPLAKLVKVHEDYVEFEGIRLKTRPMIGTIGVTPEHETPCGSLGRHGGNIDVKELTVGTKLFLPIFVEGALFGAGDVHAVQADGELCVSAVEVSSVISLKFALVKGRRPEWPTIEMKNSYAFLACGKTLDEAAEHATKTAVEALMREHYWSFEKAYMFCSLAVDLEINQVVDPEKGVRAVVSKDHLSLNSILFTQPKAVF